MPVSSLMKNVFRTYDLRLLVLSVMIFVVGCWDSTKKSLDQIQHYDKSGEVASFYIVNGEGHSLLTTDVSGEWEAPGAKIYRFKVCINSVGSNAKIAQQEFEVSDGDKVYLATAQNNGCMEWTEDPMQFNFYAKSTYIKIKREIRSRNSRHSGKRTFSFLVNPWASSRKVNQSIQEVIPLAAGERPPIRDQNLVVEGKKEISEALMGKGNPLGTAQLIVQKPILDIKLRSDNLFDTLKKDSNGNISALNREAHGFSVDSTLKLKPMVRVKNINGETVDLPVLNGMFRVFYEVVATNINSDASKSLVMTNDRTEIVTKRSPPIIARIMSDGNIDAKTTFAVEKRVSQAKFMLALRVQPLEAPSGIDTYDALFHIGNQDKFASKTAPTLAQEGSSLGRFNFYKYIKGTKDFEVLKRTYDAQNASAYDFSVAKGTYETIAPGETATQRTVLFRTETCVFSNAYIGQRVKNKQFVVFRDGQRLPLRDSRTNNEGCLNMLGEVSHGFYQPERLINVAYDIYSLAKDGKDNIVPGQKLFTLTVRVNPWDDKFTFFRDSRNVSEELAKNLEREKIESRFFVDKFSYQTLRFGYDIDDYLNLRVKKTVLFTMDPYVLRYSGIVAGRNTIHKLRDGIYLLNVAFQKDYLDPAAKGVMIKRNERAGKKSKDLFIAQQFDPNYGEYVDLSKDQENRGKRQYISIVKKLVRVNNGKIITPLELSLSDLRLLRVRSQLLIQFDPIDERLLMAANRFDQKFSTKISKEIEDRYEAMVKRFEEKYGAEEREVLENYFKFQGQTLSTLDKFRALSDKEEKAVKGEMESAQQQLVDMIKKLQTRQELEQKRAVDDPEKMADVLQDYNVYDEEFIKSLEKMDFTLMQAAPLVKDLNMLVEPWENSGLKSRTFIGPITFILNSNSSNVRPTDNLDESWCKTDDCDSLKNFGLTAFQVYTSEIEGEYRNDKYYSSIRHMSNVHVDNILSDDPNLSLMDDYEALKRQTKQEMEARSNISNFVNLYGLKFVSLEDKEKLLVPKTSCNTIYRPDFKSHCLEEDKKNSYKSKEFIDRFNDSIVSSNSVAPRISKQSLMDLVKTGKMTKGMAHGFCSMIIQEVYGDKSAMDYIPVAITDRSKLVQICHDIARSDSGILPFIVDRKLRIHKMGQNYVFNGGKQMNVNVGSNLSLSRDERFSLNTGVKYDVAGKYFGSFVQDTTGLVRVGNDYSRGKSNSESTVISEQTFLVMQTASFDIELNRYEYCASVKWNPDIFRLYKFEMLYNLFAARDERIQPPGGYFICSGIEEEVPLEIRENYYYFIQFFTDGDMLDSGDLYNHPWLLGLRGVRDASKFLSALSTRNYVLTKIGEELTDGPGWPIQKMIDTYLKVSPSFPKIYTVLDFYGPDYPRNMQPDEAFKDINARREHRASLELSYLQQRELGLPGFSDGAETMSEDGVPTNGNQLDKVSRLYLRFLQNIELDEQGEEVLPIPPEEE